MTQLAYEFSKGLYNEIIRYDIEKFIYNNYSVQTGSDGFVIEQLREVAAFKSKKTIEENKRRRWYEGEKVVLCFPLEGTSIHIG